MGGIKENRSIRHILWWFKTRHYRFTFHQKKTWIVEPYYTWNGGTSTTKYICIGIWGDGCRLASEQWDDYNKASGDGCSSTWTVEPKYSWSGGNPSNFDTCAPICGDGYKISPEKCDDGNNINEDGCSSTWIVE